MKERLIAYLEGKNCYRSELVVSGRDGKSHLDTKVQVIPRYRKYANQYGVTGFKRVN